LIAVGKAGIEEVRATLSKYGLSDFLEPIGKITAKGDNIVEVF
jgi:hypothetical protein